MKFEGSYVALITPFTATGELDEDKLRELVNWHIENGTAGIVPCGTTGEAPTLTFAEHEKVIKIVVEEVKGRIQVIAGAGSNNTNRAVELTKYAKELGADAALSTCPYYNKPSQRGLYEHYKKIAEDSKFPIMLYNVPGRTGVNLQWDTTVRLANDCENIIAIKEASGNLEQVDKIIQNKPNRFDVLSGDDALTFSMVASGAAGAISVIGNALPREFSKMIRLEFNGEYEPARTIHHRFAELYDLLFVDGNPAGVKALLSEMGFIENVLRLPLVPTRITTKQKMANILKGLQM